LLFGGLPISYDVDASSSVDALQILWNFGRVIGQRILIEFS
jgi:hypothetical protein